MDKVNKLKGLNNKKGSSKSNQKKLCNKNLTKNIKYKNKKHNLQKV
jgi:hypothetical protein